ncbi:hypothetical protein HCU64_16480 [Methylobacterium sp. C25]|uniref:hypothetical protein n=1 Tax=Methylobacterium sp. C25 TaxID=2721622 RepID=UPI001F18423B|nr:hypothetical protein [Methylobacterium sp. C25]MCE4225354.1 hypothetical protein [Methylobacterium sp. C25]
MFNIGQIYKYNRETFYDYNTGAQQSRVLYAGTIIFISLIFATGFSELSDNALAAIITAQSILAGFGFNVLFFLLSNANVLPSKKEGSIEQDLRRNKIIALSEEIFGNISYFNLVSISSVFLSLLIFIPSLSSTTTEYCVKYLMDNFHDYYEQIRNLALIAKMALRVLLFTILYILVFESIYTFIRTVVRITFYFRKRLEFLRTADQ